MSRESGLRYKLICLALALALIVPVLAACGGGEKVKETPTSSPTQVIVTPSPSPTVTVMPTITPTPTPNLEPIKVGIIHEWSGPTAISGWLSDAVTDLIEWNINDKQGGILVGGVRRLIKFIKYETGGVVAQAAAGAKRLVLEDKVSIITQGGSTTASFYAVADVTDPLKVPYVCFGTDKALIANYKWTATTISTEDQRVEEFSDFILNTLKPKTLGILAQEMSDGRRIWNALKPRLEAAGVNIVYDQWVQPGTTDLMSYLTKIKYVKPDVLISYLTQDTFMIMYKQIEELGGWGGIQNFVGNEHGNAAGVMALPAAQDSYTLAGYIPGSDMPGAVSFENLWTEKVKEDPGFGKKYGATAQDVHAFFYTCNMVALAAIELAGTDDPAKIAEALRSGNLEWDGPAGHIHIQPDGSAGVKDTICRIENKELVPLQ
jgi:ABC-type branched-subunit amino acid transport system substrate-binding protein